ncbi:unnamed protein product [Sphagnum jensenii]|uniref:Uncharacterized protein n=1 Tax=Sphagnum jensenii TaxID=128206 RepID=A0ABP0XBW7_9BRYO
MSADASASGTVGKESTEEYEVDYPKVVVEAELLDPVKADQLAPATKEAFDEVIHKENRVLLSIWRANRDQHTTSDGDKHEVIKLTAKLTLHPAPKTRFKHATIEVQLMNEDFKIAYVSPEKTVSDKESKRTGTTDLGLQIGPASHVPVGFNVGRSIQKEFSGRKCEVTSSGADTSTAKWVVMNPDPDENQLGESLIADLEIKLTHPEGATTCPAKLSVDVTTRVNWAKRRFSDGKLRVKDRIFDFDFTGLD